MNNAIHDFRAGLYREHLEEASFLYQQIAALYDNPEISWLDIGDFEARFEAHLHGLVVGDALALDICRQQVAEGDAGELHAAVRVFCRQNKYNLVSESFDSIDPADTERIGAFCNALKHDLPAPWQDRIVERLAGHPSATPVAAVIVGFRRQNQYAGALLDVLHKQPPSPPLELIWSMGRLREKKASDDLMPLLLSSDPVIRTTTECALMRMGEREPVRLWKKRPQQAYWRWLAVGLGGDRSHVPDLIDLASSNTAHPDGILALGLLGDFAAVAPLTVLLKHAELASAAALALNLITGAELYEETFIPEEIDPDLLFEDEREKLKKGEQIYPPDRQPGINIVRLSQDPTVWTTWIREHKNQFQGDTRYRNGKPFSPECLLANLLSVKTPGRIRALASDELSIRYGCSVAFETDQPVLQQQRQLASVSAWIQSLHGTIQEGKWYFAGRPVSA
jgi:uncharacterized protein (TIGR02270 family)